MAASQWAVAYDALLVALQADDTLTELGVFVSDGLPIGEDYHEDLILVGSTGVEDDTLSGTLTQVYHDNGGPSASRKDEVAVIRCAIRCSTGDVELAEMRGRAFTVLAAVEEVLRTNRSLGLTDVISTELTSLEVHAEQFSDGTSYWLSFEVTVTSLI